MVKSLDQQPIDQQLIEQYLAGDEFALEELVKRYLPLIYGLAKKYVGGNDAASDIVQEVFVKVWKNLKNFDQNKSFRTWIFTIAKRTAIDWLKKKNALPFSALENEDDKQNFAELLVDESPSIVERLSLNEASKVLVTAMAQLPAGYAAVMELRLNGELSFSEIAKTLKKPLNTVKSRYRRGLALLKKLL